MNVNHETPDVRVLQKILIHLDKEYNPPGDVGGCLINSIRYGFLDPFFEGANLYIASKLNATATNLGTELNIPGLKAFAERNLRFSKVYFATSLLFTAFLIAMICVLSKNPHSLEAKAVGATFGFCALLKVSATIYKYTSKKPKDYNEILDNSNELAKMNLQRVRIIDTGNRKKGENLTEENTAGAKKLGTRLVVISTAQAGQVFHPTW